MRRFACFVFALLLAACGDDAEPTLRPDQMQLVKVSGDEQAAPVAGTDAGLSNTLIRASVAASAAEPDLLPDPLVARITGDGANQSISLTGPSFSMAPAGPNFDQLPANTVVTFRVPDEGPDACGRSFVDAAAPDDSSYVTTYWERPTRAGTCEMEARLIVDGEAVIDEVFTAVFEPGPAYESELRTGRYRIGSMGGEGKLAVDLFTDQHQNAVPYRATASRILGAAGDTVGTEAARTLQLDRIPTEGDTLTVSFYAADGSLLADATGTFEAVFTDSDPIGWILELTTRTLNLHP